MKQTSTQTNTIRQDDLSRYRDATHRFCIRPHSGDDDDDDDAI